MAIGIISDTHDNVENIKRAVGIFKKEGLAYVLHLGDYVSPFSVLAFSGIKLFGVLGNNDGDIYHLQKAFTSIGGTLCGEFYEFEEDGLKIAAYHGTNPQLKDALLSSQKYDVVLCGHTHKKALLNQGKTLFFNPGTASALGEESSIGILDTKKKRARFIRL